MPLPPIIGLAGPAGAGKSTAARYLESRGVARHSFARPLKEIVRLTLDLTEAQVYGTQAEKDANDPRYGFSPRWFLQRLGTEGVRTVLGENFWTRIAIEKIQREAVPASIEDVRFLNEAAAIVEAGGVVIRLFPPGWDAERDARNLSSHASEREWLGMTGPRIFDVRPPCLDVEQLCTLIDGVLARIA